MKISLKLPDLCLTFAKKKPCRKQKAGGQKHRGFTGSYQIPKNKLGKTSEPSISFHSYGTTCLQTQGGEELNKNVIFMVTQNKTFAP